MSEHSERVLATFAATLRIAANAAPVLRRAEELMPDWLGRALAGKRAPTVQAIARTLLAIGPPDGVAGLALSWRRMPWAGPP